MKIQITGYREYEKDGKTIKYMNAFFKNKWRASSVVSLLQNIDKTIENIPEKERFNLFYTLSNFNEGVKHREGFAYCNVLAFDIDSIDHSKLGEYIAIIAETLKLRTDEFSIVDSGRGLHILINLRVALDEVGFKKHKPEYDLICGLMNTAFFKAGLPGNADSVVFENKRVFRLPNTRNLKPNKPEAYCKVIQVSEQIVDFNFYDVTGTFEATANDQLSTKILKREACPTTVFNECAFMSKALTEGETMSEPEWYAALTITARMEDHHKWSHKISEKHDAYDPEETDLKIDHALNSTGPRTCRNISTMFDGCMTCPHWGTCTSPVQLRPEGEILSEDDGYWIVEYVGKEGKKRYIEPDYEALVKVYEKERPYTVGLESQIIYRFNGKFWQPIEDLEVKTFMSEIMEHKKPHKGHTEEFLHRIRVQLRNQRKEEWFTQETKRFINLDNGVLCLDTMTLGEHSPNKGFMYCLPFEYDESAGYSLWQSFLDQVIPCKEFQRILQEYFGYCLSYMDAQIGQKALILKGEGSNGKSIIIDMLRNMVGKINSTTIDIKRAGSNPEARTKLYNKMLAIVEEIPGQGTLSDEFFKTAVAGGYLDARRLYKGTFDFKCNAKFIISTNNDINFGGSSSSAIIRRLLVIPFNVVIPYHEQDRQLGRKLHDEISGVFNWALAGLKNFGKNNEFTITQKIDNAARSSMENENFYAQWFSECCEYGENEFSTTIDLFEDFKDFHQNDRRIVKNTTVFSRGLKKYLKTFKGIELESVRKRVGADQKRGYSISIIDGENHATF